MKAKEKDIIVEVLRDYDGTIYSQVVDNNLPIRTPRTLVVDRQKGRGLDIHTIKHRAKLLADLLGVDYKEDFTWHCVAIEKRPCRCPECVKRGNA